MKKKLIVAIVVIAAILVALAAVLIARAVAAAQPPSIDSVRERYQSLIEASHEINAIFYGEGLPTYPRIEESAVTYPVTYGETEYQISYATFEDSEGREMVRYVYYINAKETVLEDGEEKQQYVLRDAATFEELTSEQIKDQPYRFVEKTKEDRGNADYRDEKTGFYYYLIPDYPQLTFTYSSEDAIYYDYCTKDCGYTSTDDIKEAASLVYSEAYLSRIYEMQFDGVATDTALGYARYRDESGSLQKFMPGRISPKTEEVSIPVWEYDYDSMEIVKKESNATSVTIRLNGRESAGAAWESVTFSFALENGEWYLDSLPGFPRQELSV